MGWKYIGSVEADEALWPRPCDWCGQLIEVGQPYRADTGMREGEVFTGEMHPECEQALQSSHIDEGYSQYKQGRGIPME